MSASFEIDTRRFNRTMREYASITKKGLVDVGLGAAKGFVKRAVAITPPSTGSAVGAKQRGESKVRGDIAKVIMGTRRKTKVDPNEIHERFRRSNGSVSTRIPENRRWRVNRVELKAYVARKMANVGMLLGGWVASAKKLGLNLPAWITRHGSQNGACLVTISNGGVTITMSNKVKFVGGVRGLNRRVQSALGYQENAMRRQINFLLDKARKRAFR